VIALLDTHALLWWLEDNPQLGAGAREVVADPASVVFVSAVSVWEIAIKRAIGKLRAPDGLTDRIDDAGFERLPVGFDHAERVGSLPLHHGDPFDRLLVAQALVEGATLVTSDRLIEAYDVPRLAARAPDA
jgi:PIN domain nuclease of toxin-antitoxin system